MPRKHPGKWVAKSTTVICKVICVYLFHMGHLLAAAINEGMHIYILLCLSVMSIHSVPIVSSLACQCIAKGSKSLPSLTSLPR